MNWLCSTNSSTIRLNRPLLASSSAASTSSRMQNGLGLLLKMLISSAMHVIVFSPPESWLIVAGFLPGGWAMISMPASRMSTFFFSGKIICPSGPSIGLAFLSSISVSR